MNEANLVQIPFYETVLWAMRTGDEFADVLVAMRPIVDGMGLAWQPQHRKLLEHPILSTCVTNTMMQMPGDDQRREWTFLPLTRVNFWLATIQPNKIPDADLRAKVIRYQEECADVLFAHFFEKAAPPPEVATPEDLRSIRSQQLHILRAAKIALSPLEVRQLWNRMSAVTPSPSACASASDAARACSAVNPPA